MKFASPLLSGRLIKRYKRFLCDIALDNGTSITATCPNTGSMLGLTTPGARVWVSTSSNPKRKYAHTWELIEADIGDGPTMVGINTNHPNAIVAEAIGHDAIAELTGYPELRREVRYGANSRIDIFLQKPGQTEGCYVEIKNVHLLRKRGLAEFPDSKTERGVKHLGELTNMVAEGHRAVMLFLVQRADCTSFTIAADIDPKYAEAFAAAHAAGVEMLCYRTDISPEGIEIASRVPIIGLN